MCMHVSLEALDVVLQVLSMCFVFAFFSSGNETCSLTVLEVRLADQ